MTSSPSPKQIELAARLREIRFNLKLTQAELAALLSADRPVQGPTISTWENLRNPVRPPRERLSSYARLHVTAGRDGGAVLIPLHKLPEPERNAYDEESAALFDLYDDAEPQLHEDEQSRKLWDFSDDGPLAIICPAAPADSRGPLADPGNPNYTETHAFADLDALLDIYGHLRMKIAGRFPVTYHSADRYRIEDLSGHLVLLGGMGWNELFNLLQPSLKRLPVSQIDVDNLKTGEVFKVEGIEKLFYPEWADEDHTTLYRDVGYIARTRNPYNPHRTLTLCNGIHSRGVLGAVRTLTDIRFRSENEDYIAERFGTGDFAILIRVPVVRGRAIGVALSDPDAVLYSWPDEGDPS